MRGLRCIKSVFHKAFRSHLVVSDGLGFMSHACTWTCRSSIFRFCLMRDSTNESQYLLQLQDYFRRLFLASYSLVPDIVDGKHLKILMDSVVRSF